MERIDNMKKRLDSIAVHEAGHSPYFTGMPYDAID